MRPMFEVATPAGSAAAKRLTTAAAVRALIGSPEADDGLLESIIDGVSSKAASFCKLERDVAGTVPTFGSETVRATWMRQADRRGAQLILPWRVPITAISSAVEDGVTLAGTDYSLPGGGLLERLDGADGRQCWSRGKIVVTYVVGWDLTADPSVVPPELLVAVADQVKTQYLARKRDPSLRSESVPGLYSGEYAVPGGTGFGLSGLLTSVEDALGPYRDWSQA